MTARVARGSGGELSVYRADQLVYDVSFVLAVCTIHIEAIVAIRHEDDQRLDLPGQDERIGSLIEMPFVDPIRVVTIQAMQHNQQRQIGQVAPIRRQVDVVRLGLAKRHAVNGAGDHHPAVGSAWRRVLRGSRQPRPEQRGQEHAQQ